MISVLDQSQMNYTIDDIKLLFSHEKALVLRGFSQNNRQFCEFSEKLSKNFSTYQGGILDRSTIDGKKYLLSVDNKASNEIRISMPI